MFSELSAILLCGGRSDRMGLNKGLIEWKGQPLIVRLAELLEELFGDVLLITGQERRYTELIDLPILKDKMEGLGPLGGIYTGLLASGNEHNLVAACDMPQVKPELLKLLVGEIDDSPLIVPQVGGFLEPLLAVYSKRCISKIEHLFQLEKLKPLDLLELLPAKIIPEEKLRKVDPGLESFFNLNAPEDLRPLSPNMSRSSDNVAPEESR